MPSRNNPNVPAALKPRTAHKIKIKRQKGQRAARKNSNTTPARRTSQAVRKAAPVSAKKARKLETKKLHARNRAIEEALRESEVEMRDAGSRSEKVGENGKTDPAEALRAPEVEMRDVWCQGENIGNSRKIEWAKVDEVGVHSRGRWIESLRWLNGRGPF